MLTIAASADKSKALLNERYSLLERTRVRPWHLTPKYVLLRSPDLHDALESHYIKFSLYIFIPYRIVEISDRSIKNNAINHEQACRNKDVKRIVNAYTKRIRYINYNVPRKNIVQLGKHLKISLKYSLYI